jgi:hypothetical protein
VTTDMQRACLEVSLITLRATLLNMRLALASLTPLTNENVPTCKRELHLHVKV